MGTNMKILRVDTNREILDAERIEIEVDGTKYSLTEQFGKLRIHSHDDFINVHPGSCNVIEVSGDNHD